MPCPSCLPGGRAEASGAWTTAQLTRVGTDFKPKLSGPKAWALSRLLPLGSATARDEPRCLTVGRVHVPVFSWDFFFG